MAISAKKLDLGYPMMVTLKDIIQSTKLEHDNTLQGDSMLSRMNKIGRIL